MILNKTFNILLSDNKLWKPIFYSKYNDEYIQYNVPYYMKYIKCTILNNFFLKYNNACSDDYFKENFRKINILDEKYNTTVIVLDDCTIKKYPMK